ncbi:MAG: ATP-dependent DNA helicase RecG, partial [Candidatus Desulfobacillus denitrificans]
MSKPGALPGATPATAAKLAQLGIRTHSDLVLHLPLRYEDETRLTAVADLRPGVPAQVEAEIVDASVQYRPRPP